jgi:hypothetical protein
MRIKTSKIGVAFVAVFFLVILVLILMFPVSMGFSLLLIGVLSMPWNELISKAFDFQYGSLSLSAVGPGLIINGIILYSIGYAIEKLIRDRKMSAHDSERS